MKDPHLDATLAWENYVIAQCVQALIGNVSPPLRQVGCVVREGAVDLQFYAANSAEIADDIEEICFELAVLLEVQLEVNHSVSLEPLDWHRRELIPLFGVKPDW